MRSFIIALMTLVFLLATPAQAQHTIDPTRTGTIELQFLHSNPHDDVPGPSAVGVGAQARRLIDASVFTNDGWHELSALRAKDLLHLGVDAFDITRTGFSDGVGVVQFADLPLGAYLIQPTDGDVFEPFVVVVPTTGPGGAQWVYTVRAYPKVSGSGDAGGIVPDPDDDSAVSPGMPTLIPTTTLMTSPTPQPGAGSNNNGGDGAESGTGPVSGGQGGGSENAGVRDFLASTGANTWGVILGGFFLMLSGIALLLRKSRNAANTKTQFSSLE